MSPKRLFEQDLMLFGHLDVVSYMANPAYDVTKITDEIKINPRWRTANYFKSKYFKK
jgi:hypothetical protein